MNIAAEIPHLITVTCFFHPDIMSRVCMYELMSINSLASINRGHTHENGYAVLIN